MAISNETLAVAMAYVQSSLAGVGAIAGKPCQIQSITPITGGHRVTYLWVDNNDEEHTSTMDVMDGADGRDGSIVSVTPTLSSGTKIGEIEVDGNTYSLYAPNGGGGSAELTDDLDTVVAVGGINAGTHYNVGESLETILRDMLDPVLYPTLTNPSATLATSGSTLLETGSTPSHTLTATFNRGSINPAYGTSGYRAGVATAYALNGGESQEENTWTETITPENKTFRASVSYGEGEQPKDSKGNDYSTPLAEGSVNTNTVNYEFVDALWANTANIATIAKLALVSKSAKVKTFSFPSATVANPEVFDVPSSWTLTALEVLNTLNNQWENCSTEFSTSSVTHNDASGTSVNYTRYTCNLGYAMGARQIRIKWS